MDQYKETAQKICYRIVDFSVDSARGNLALDIILDGTTYEADVMSHEDDEMYTENVQIDNLQFPCCGFSISNGIAVFECMDPIDAAPVKCMKLGEVANAIKAVGIDSIRKAVVKLEAKGKIQTADVKNVETCWIFEERCLSGKKMLVLYALELDKYLDLSYTSAIQKIAEQQFNDEMGFSESMNALGKRYFGEDEDYAQNQMHNFTIRFNTDKSLGAACRCDIDAANVEDAVKLLLEDAPDLFPRHTIVCILSIAQDGKPMSKAIVKRINSDFFAEFNECDGGGAVGGDAGGAVGGDAGSGSIGDAGDTAAEMNGTSVSDVLGTCKPGGGYMGKDNFYIPARAKVPLHHWEAANGGSKRKKKGKYPYEKGMKVVVSMFEDEMLNEGEGLASYEALHGARWEDIKEKAYDKARDHAAKHGVKFDRYAFEKSLDALHDRWEAAQYDPPDVAAHGEIGACVIDEDKFKRDYLKNFFVHGWYEDGTMLEIGPMKRSIASAYMSLHKLSMNSKAFQQMKASNFSGVREIGSNDPAAEIPLTIIKMSDGFWLYSPQTRFKAGPFANKQLARMYAYANRYTMEKKGPSDKGEEGQKLKYPVFSFSYTMLGIPCMDIVVAEDMNRAMKLFDLQWRMFDNTRPVKDKFNTIADLQRDLSLLRIKDIEIEELDGSNVEEYEELAAETGNPSTIPQLMKRCRNPKFKYILGRENSKGGRLVIEPFSESGC